MVIWQVLHPAYPGISADRGSGLRWGQDTRTWPVIGLIGNSTRWLVLGKVVGLMPRGDHAGIIAAPDRRLGGTTAQTGPGWQVRLALDRPKRQVVAPGLILQV